MIEGHLPLHTTMDESVSDPDPDSDEIYQNFSAGEVLVQGLAGVVSQEDVARMVGAQKQMLQEIRKQAAQVPQVHQLAPPCPPVITVTSPKGGSPGLPAPGGHSGMVIYPATLKNKILMILSC